MGKSAEISIGVMVDASGMNAGISAAQRKLVEFQQTVNVSGHLSKVFQDAQAPALKLGEVLGGVRRGLNAIGTAILPFAGLAAVGFVKAATAASDLNETVSKVGVVFGDATSKVTAAADEMAAKFGIPKRAFLDAASSIGLIGKASGLSQSAAADLSVKFAKLAIDASSFYNVPLEEALMSMRSGLVGEAEPMRRFGVLLNEAAVKSEAMRLGLARGNAELSEAAKVQARVSLITKGMSDAQGDLARTASSPANLAREAWGRVENVLASVGSSLQAPFSDLLRMLSGAVEGVGSALEGSSAYLADWAEGGVAVFGTVLEGAKWLFGTLGEWLAAATRGFHEFRGGLLTLAADAAHLVGATAFEEELRGKASADFAKLDELRGLKNAAGEVKTAASGMGAALKESLAKGAEAAAAAAKKVEELAKKTGDLTRKLFEERATFGMSSREAEVYKLALEGANESQLAMARSLAAQMDAADEGQKRFDDLASGAKSIIEETQTPLERLEQETKRIGAMLDFGLIDTTTAARAYEAANQKSGLFETKYAGAMSADSEAARSTLLRADATAPGGRGPDDELRRIAEQGRNTGEATAQMNAAIQQMHGLMRQFLTATTPVMGRL